MSVPRPLEQITRDKVPGGTSTLSPFVFLLSREPKACLVIQGKAPQLDLLSITGCSWIFLLGEMQMISVT